MRHRRCGCEMTEIFEKWLKMSVEVIWEPLKGLFQGVVKFCEVIVKYLYKTMC